MGEDSKIEWCHHTFNIVWGCVKKSPGCKFCYAQTWAERLGYGTTKPALWGPGSERRILSDSYWQQPLKWNADAEKAGERRRVFSSSMADLFEDHPVTNAQRNRLWPLIKATPMLDWLLLTKEHQNISRFVPWVQHPWENVWLGVSAENQDWLDIRVPVLLHTPAAVHFISAEPLLGLLNLKFYLRCVTCRGTGYDANFEHKCGTCFGMPRVDWVIAGGESGSEARPMNPLWVRWVKDQCTAADTAFLFKQWGEWLALGPKYPTRHRGTKDYARVDGKVREVIVDADAEVTHGGERGVIYARMGKHDAGRMLDGKVWDGYPEEA